MTEKLAASLSGTPLEEELASVEAGLERVPPADLVFDASAYSEHTLERVRAEWRWRMAFEHRSSMVFAQLAQQYMLPFASTPCPTMRQPQ